MIVMQITDEIAIFRCCCLTEVNRSDYRAWYGLGQTYEILKMNTYCLYYYMMAQVLRYIHVHPLSDHTTYHSTDESQTVYIYIGTVVIPLIQLFPVF